MPVRFSIKGGAFESSKFECVLKQTQYRRSQRANSSCLLFSLQHLEKSILPGRVHEGGPREDSYQPELSVFTLWSLNA